MTIVYRQQTACLLALVLFATSAGGSTEQQGMDARIGAAVEASATEIIELRHQIHQNPELGNREFETAALVAEHLRALGMEVTTGVAHTGVIGILRGGRPGPVVAVRADMDALPVTEDTPYEFKSTVRTTYLGQEVGVMHACGHDIHTAVQMGVASVLASLKDDLPGTVKFIFQPAEEGPPPGERGGAELMFEEGVLENPRPSAVFGLHALAEMEVGKVGFTVGPALAAVDHFIAKIEGRQAHGAYPHLSIDTVVMAAQAIMALQTIRSRNLPALEPSVVTVGIIRDAIEGRMYEILAGITAAGGGSYELDYQRGSPTTINDPGLAAEMLPTLARVVGAGNVITLDPVMGGEDFSIFANDVPGFFFRLGQVKPGTVSGNHHTPTFLADDSAVPVGMRAMSTLLLDYLSAPSRQEP